MVGDAMPSGVFCILRNRLILNEFRNRQHCTAQLTDSIYNRFCLQDVSARPGYYSLP